MSTLNLRGITWEVYGSKDGKAIWMHKDCTISFDQRLGVYLFHQSGELILARELRCDCIQAATDWILECYAGTFVPCWEEQDGTTCLYLENVA